MSTETDDPFEAFAKAMASSEEVAEKLLREKPPIPTRSMSEAERIDLYVRFERWLKEKRAADAAITKSLRTSMLKSIEEIATSRGFPEVTDILNANVSGAILGNEHGISVEYVERREWDQNELRKLDVDHTIGHPFAHLDPVNGLKVKYSANPDEAVDTDIKVRLEAAMSNTYAERKIKPIIGGAAFVGASGDEE